MTEEQLNEARSVIIQYVDGAITIYEVINWIVVHFPAGVEYPDNFV